VTVAVVLTFDSAIATEGTTATFPPAAPVFAFTVAWCVVAAAIARLRPPVTEPLRLAAVFTSMRATATDAPVALPSAPDPPPGAWGTHAEPAFDVERINPTPPLATAYLHLALGDRRYFFTAPRALYDSEAPLTVIGLLNLDSAHFGLARVCAKERRCAASREWLQRLVALRNPAAGRLLLEIADDSCFRYCREQDQAAESGS